MDEPIHVNKLGQPIGYPVVPWSPPPFPPHRELAGRFCRLEPLDPERHARELHESISADADGANWTYLPYGPFPGFAEFSHWMETFCTNRDPQFYAIRSMTTNSAVGWCSYLRIEPRNGSVEVGHLNYSPSLQRTPAATEAMYLLMKNAFELGYRRYEWKCDALNTPSCTAAQRLGFSPEGLFRQAVVYKGRNRDTAWFAVIDREWPALEQAFTHWLSPDNFDENGVQRVSLRELTRPTLGGEFPSAHA